MNINAFLMSLTLCGLLVSTCAAEEGPIRNVNVRDNFAHSLEALQVKKTARVAFIGGSITEMNGYRPMVMKYLTERFPETKFDFIAAGISSTCSTTGAFRLDRDVLSKGKIDLFFIEFAVNDDQDAMHSPQNCVRGMEGIIRQALAANPHMDIVLTYFVNPPMLEKIQAGKVPASIAAHEQVAKQYRISSIMLAHEVADRIKEKTLTWKEYGGTHPKPKGNAIPAKMIEAMLNQVFAPAPSPKQERTLPDPIDKFSYSHGHFVNAEQIEYDDGWQRYRPDWKEIPGSFRATFAKDKLYCTTTPDKPLTINFKGTALGAYVLAGPDAGTLEVSIDGGEPVSVNLYHHYSKSLHYPRTVMFANELEPGQHTAKVSLAPRDDGKPTAARVLEFVAN